MLVGGADGGIDGRCDGSDTGLGEGGGSASGASGMERFLIDPMRSSTTNATATSATHNNGRRALRAPPASQHQLKRRGASLSSSIVLATLALQSSSLVEALWKPYTMTNAMCAGWLACASLPSAVEQRRTGSFQAVADLAKADDEIYGVRGTRTQFGNTHSTMKKGPPEGSPDFLGDVAFGD